MPDTREKTGVFQKLTRTPARGKKPIRGPRAGRFTVVCDRVAAAPRDHLPPPSKLPGAHVQLGTTVWGGWFPGETPPPLGTRRRHCEFLKTRQKRARGGPGVSRQNQVAGDPHPPVSRISKPDTHAGGSTPVGPGGRSLSRIGRSSHGRGDFRERVDAWGVFGSGGGSRIPAEDPPQVTQRSVISGLVRLAGACDAGPQDPPGAPRRPNVPAITPPLIDRRSPCR
jgi:hypothetical protein